MNIKRYIIDLFLEDCQQTRNSSKTDFLLLGLKQQLSKIHNSCLIMYNTHPPLVTVALLLMNTSSSQTISLHYRPTDRFVFSFDLFKFSV